MARGHLRLVEASPEPEASGRQLDGPAEIFDLDAWRLLKARWQADKAARAPLGAPHSRVLWLTGPSEAARPRIANLLERELHALGHHTYLLDGDTLRHGLGKDLGASDADRVENIVRIARVAKLMAGAGLIVLAAFISPRRADRKMARALFDDGEFVEVFVDAPLSASGGANSTPGVDAPIKHPTRSKVWIDTSAISAHEAAGLIVDELRRRQLIPSTS